MAAMTVTVADGVLPGSLILRYLDSGEEYDEWLYIGPNCFMRTGDPGRVIGMVGIIMVPTCQPAHGRRDRVLPPPQRSLR